MITVDKLTLADRPQWQVLFRSYLDFYERTLTADLYDHAWTAFQDDTRVHALGARLDGRSVNGRHQAATAFQADQVSDEATRSVRAAGAPMPGACLRP